MATSPIQPDILWHFFDHCGKGIILIRGVPGSGKTTMAEALKSVSPETYVPCSADEFYLNPEGDYRWSKEYISKAHMWCKLNTLKALYHKQTPVVNCCFVSNWEMDDYFKMAVEERVPVLVVTLKTRFQNQHGVPEDKVADMEKRFVHYMDISFPEELQCEVFNADSFDALLLSPRAV